MKEMKRTKDDGLNNQFLDTFLGEMIELTVDMDDKSGDHFAVRGTLLSADNKYYYIGTTEHGVVAAVKISRVILATLFDPLDQMQEDILNRMKKPDDGDFN